MFEHCVDVVWSSQHVAEWGHCVAERRGGEEREGRREKQWIVKLFSCMVLSLEYCNYHSLTHMCNIHMM